MIAQGGTGASSVAGAWTNLGLGTSAGYDYVACIAGQVSKFIIPGGWTCISDSDSLDNTKLPLDGSVAMTGALNMNGKLVIGVANPIDPDHAANKAYVDAQVGGVNSSQWITSTPDIYFNTGNVGIGTAAPASSLHLSGTATALRLDNTSLTSTVKGINLSLDSSGGSDGPTLLLERVGGGGNLYWKTSGQLAWTEGRFIMQKDLELGGGARLTQSGDTDLILANTGTTKNILFTTNGSEAMRIDSLRNIEISNRIKFKSDNSNFVELKAPLALASSLTFNLPGTAGSSGNALVTDGAGNLSWATVATGSSAVGGDLSGTISNATIVSGAVTSAKIADGTIVDADVSATAAIAQSKISGLTTALSGKEPAITAGTNLQYWSGDKTWQTLNTAAVPEQTNLYFTETRVLGTDLAGYSAGAGPITASDTVLSAIEKLSGNQGNYVLKSGDTMTGALVVPAPTLAGHATNKNYVDTLVSGSSHWTKVGNDIHYTTGNVGIGATAPGAKLEVAGQVKITGGDPAAGKVLTSDATGLATWQSPSAAGITALTGDVTGTGPGSTATTIAAGAVTYAKTNFADGIIPQAKIENLVTSLAAKEPVISAGTAAQYWAGTKTWQSFDASVRAALMGVTYAPATIPPFNVSTTDSFQTAISKLEKRIGDAETTLAASIPADNSVSSAKIADGSIVNADVAAAANIEATKLGTGAVDNTEFNYLDGLTSAIQTQLNGKEPTVTGTGSTADFYSGNKTFRNLGADVRATPLTGYAVGTNSVLSGTDSVLGAFGKTQAQLNALSTTVGSLSASSWLSNAGNLHFDTGNVGIGMSTPGIVAGSSKYLTIGIKDNNAHKTSVEIYSGGNHSNLTDSGKLDFIFRSTAGTDVNAARISAQVGDNTTRAHLGFYTRGLAGSLTQKMIIDQEGRTGIGTTAPASRLQVAGGIQLSDDTDACPGAANVKLGTLRYTAGTTLQLCVPTGWTNVGVATNRIVNGNYTGTGTGAFTVSLGFRPKIVVVKNVNGTYGGQVIAIDGIPDTATQLRNYDPNGVPNSANVGGVRITNTGFDATGTVNDSTFNVAGASYYYTAIGDAIVDSQWITNGADIYRNTGKVAIGTTVPRERFNIANGHLFHTGGSLVHAFNAYYDDAVPSWRFAGYATNSHGATMTYAPNTGSLSFEMSPSPGNAGELMANPLAMIITKTGNVGIGTATPVNKLDVAGGIRTTGDLTLQSTAADVGDIVFLESNNNQKGRVWTDPLAGAESLHLSSGDAFPDLTVNPAGNIGIGTVSPLQRLHVNGAIRTETAASDCPGGWTCTGYFWDMSIASMIYSGLLARSDRRLKDEIASLDDEDLERLKKLRPVHYIWRDPQFGEGVKYGFIAQEVEEVWPSLVETAEDAMATKSMDYTQMISPLVKGFQKHDREIASLKAENEALKRENAEIKARLDRIEEALLNKSK